MNARPHVTLAYAQSLDGSIAARPGEPLTLSGPESLRLTHQLRAQHDAILVGIGTVLADNPRLNVRLVEGPDPQPVILDSHLRFPLDARLLGNPHKPWIVSVKPLITQASEDRAKVLESTGSEVFKMAADSDGRVDLPTMLKVLSSRGIQSLMVEGGAQVITAFLKAGLVDELVLTIAPVFVGGFRAVEALLSGDRFPRLTLVSIEPCGSDWIVRGTFRT